MALHYQTEYRLGDRGRICRSYTGIQAFAAIAFDLVFGMLFELVFTAIALAMRLAVLAVHMAFRLLRVYWRAMVVGMTLLVYVVTLPFAGIHRAVDRLRRPDDEPAYPGHGPGSLRKPSWALSREV